MSSRYLMAALLYLMLSAPALAVAPFQSVREAWRPSYGYLLDRHGQLLSELRLDPKGRRSAWVPLEDISPALVKAVLAGEDRRFYRHHGVDWRAVGAALLGRIRGERLRGASTLSMQLAALLDFRLAPHGGRRGLMQKFRQIRAAMRLEDSWSKAEILEAYVNLVDFRGENRGVGAAASALFGKRALGLDDGEAALLAALIPSPGAGPEAVGRRACAIARVAALNASCDGLKHLAFRHPVEHQPASREPDLAPQLARRLVHVAGDSVRTSLDRDLQQKVLAALRRQLAGLTGRNVRDGAALVADNRSGEILAYVASANPGSAVDGIQAGRQAGSTLKPFLYGLALEKRYLTAASLLSDAPLNLQTAAGLYIPQNYERDFKGLVSARTALAGSLNIPAVRVLMLVGVDRFRDRLRDFGYLGIREAGEYYGYSLALGSAEVSLSEQVNAYRALANGGRLSPLHYRPGEPVGPSFRVLDEGATFVVSDILSDRAGRAVSFGLANPLATRFWTAVKTGTSKDMRDNWCLGYSSRYTVGVWVGNFAGDSMRDVSGVSGAAPAWLEIMNALHESEPSMPPKAPASLAGRQIRFQSGLEPERREWFMAGTETGEIHLAGEHSATARIRSPADGTVIALDPDIPAANQAVFFSASPAGSAGGLALDGRALSASSDYRWKPQPGSHRLTLVSAAGKVLDTVGFSVRRLRD
jgi:penicillin-binding protein 1C